MRNQAVLIWIAAIGLFFCIILLVWMWWDGEAAKRELSGAEVAQKKDLQESRPTRSPAPKRKVENIIEAEPTRPEIEKPAELGTAIKRAAKLRVVAAENGLDLHQVAVVEVERPDLSRVEHPGQFRSARELCRGDSPLSLPINFEIWDRLAILAPGREALFFSLDARTNSDRHFELKLGASLRVELEGFQDDDFRAAKTRLVIRKNDRGRPVIIDRPCDLGRRFDLTNLAAGSATLTIERYPIDSAPPLALALISLSPGAQERLQLQRLPDPLKIRIVGEVVLPEFLQTQEWCNMSFQQEDSSFKVEAYASREPATAPALDFSAELPAVGSWRATIEGQSFVFDVGAQGREDLRFVLKKRAPLKLSFTGMEARDLLVTWKTETEAGTGFLDEEKNLQVLNPPAGLIEIQLEADDGFQIERVVVPDEGTSATIEMRPATSFWIGAKFEDTHVQLDMEELIVIERIEPGFNQHRIILRDPFRCRVALAEPGRYRLSLREAPAGYLKPEALIVELDAGSKSQLAFRLERKP